MGSAISCSIVFLFILSDQTPLFLCKSKKIATVMQIMCFPMVIFAFVDGILSVLDIKSGVINDGGNLNILHRFFLVGILSFVILPPVAFNAWLFIRYKRYSKPDA